MGENSKQIYDINIKSSKSWVISPIDIDGNGSWVGWAFNYTWLSGTGTSWDPYTIENVTINAGGSIGISIKNSDVSFLLKNITIENFWAAAIVIDNAHNGKIINGNYSEGGTAISLSESNNMNISGNIMNDNIGTGVYLSNSNNSIISDNIMINTGTGINLLNSCNNSIISKNTITDGSYGIGIDTDNSIVFGNEIHWNFFKGISVYGDDNLIYLNSISNSNDNSEDLGTNNHWNNSIVGNYWEDYFGSDGIPIDGIGESPYSINVAPGIYDYKPLLYPTGGDMDSDGLTNEEEWLVGIDGYQTNVTNPDSDYEGLNDYLEWQSGTDPWDPDTDSDTFDDYTEVTLGTDPNIISWYPMPNLNIVSFSVGDIIEGNPFTLDFTIQNNGIWKAEGINIIIRCESLDLTLYNNSAELFDLEVDESIHILSDTSGISTSGSYGLTLIVDPSNLILETYSSNDGSFRSDWESDNSEQIQMNILPSEEGGGPSEPDLLRLIATTLSIIGGTVTVLGIFYKTIFIGRIKPKAWAKELVSSRDENVRFHAVSKLKKSKSMKKVVINALQKATYDEIEKREIRNLAKKALEERGILVKDS